MKHTDRPANLPQSAAALRYRNAQGAPTVVAKGRGLLAEEIIRRGREAGIYVHESPELVSLLMQIDIDERIPAELYSAVAEVLAWVWHMELQQGRNGELRSLIGQ